MINKKIPLKMIRYNKMEISDELQASIETRGIVIPIKVEYIDESTYRCIDGHKRCNACKQIEIQSGCEILVSCMLINDFSKSGSTFWGIKNHH